MIYTADEYAKKFPFKGKEVSVKTIIRKCAEGLLPHGHYARQLPSKSGEKGQWVVEVPQEVMPIAAIKPPPVKHEPEPARRYYNLR